MDRRGFFGTLFGFAAWVAGRDPVRVRPSDVKLRRVPTDQLFRIEQIERKPYPIPKTDLFFLNYSTSYERVANARTYISEEPALTDERPRARAPRWGRRPPRWGRRSTPRRGVDQAEQMMAGLREQHPEFASWVKRKREDEVG